MGMYDKIDAYDRQWWDNFNKRCEASREELKDVEPVDESTLNPEDFINHQVFQYELKNHKPIGSMTYDDVFLYLDLNGANPFEFDGFAIYKNSSNDVFLGIAVDEN